MSDRFWYKDAIIYQLHVKSFFDSNSDGIGDLKGLTVKLDHLVSLGVTAVWLLPFYPSPLKDDGYDTADYFGIHPQYGVLRDFKKFLSEAHKRGLRVVTELVINHTSDQHPWFQRARRAPPGSVHRDFYVWSDTPEKYAEARIIFKDFETSNWSWDPVAKAYYWHRFYAHQPDLNFDSPHVQKAVFKIIDFWMDMGVDGMRLDAVPYLFERDGTNCENLPETYSFIRKLRAHVDARYRDRMLLAEANQWPEDAAAYFGKGKGCHMAFHFPLMPRMFMSLRMEDRFPIVDILEQTPKIPPSAQWAIFLRNHDELTLEMVTDEERDYMYKIYAKDATARINLGIRRRLAPLLQNNRRKMEIMYFLLFSLPGTPIIYYGDEIAMGDNYYLGDRDGVRTPMQWSPDRNAGFSRANPQKLFLPVIIDPEYHYEAFNVETLNRNASSFLWWMRRMISMRKRFKAFGRGTIEFLLPENQKILVFLRRYRKENLLVVVNLSRFYQSVELDLSRFAGFVPVEIFSGNRFPIIRETPYLLSLGFHDYVCFELVAESQETSDSDGGAIFEIKTRENWLGIFKGKTLECLEETVLPAYLKRQRWFGGKARVIRKISVQERIPIGSPSRHLLVILEIFFTDGESCLYQLPLSFASGAREKEMAREHPCTIIAKIKNGRHSGILFDAVYTESFRLHLWETIRRKKSHRGAQGSVVGSLSRLKPFERNAPPPARSEMLKAEQSNTSFVFGNESILKLYRKVEEGVNPDLELGRFLSEKRRFSHVPKYQGWIQYHKKGQSPLTLGILQELVPNQGDAWSFMQDAVGRYFENVQSRRNHGSFPAFPASLLDPVPKGPAPFYQEAVGPVILEMIALLGRRTAELHRSLSSEHQDPAFSPESFSLLYQRSLFQSLQSHSKRVFQVFRKQFHKLPAPLQETARPLLNSEKAVIRKFRRILRRKIATQKMRIHGDYHLGQVLFTGNDFWIIDFEGEPLKPLSERKLKRSPMRDVAGMIRSFHYAAYTTLLQHPLYHEHRELEEWAERWYQVTGRMFLHSYLSSLENAPILPNSREDLSLLLDAFLIDKAVYELHYELNNRPDWTLIPVKGILLLLKNA